MNKLKEFLNSEKWFRIKLRIESIVFSLIFGGFCLTMFLVVLFGLCYIGAKWSEKRGPTCVVCRIEGNYELNKHTSITFCDKHKKMVLRLYFKEKERQKGQL